MAARCFFSLLLLTAASSSQAQPAPHAQPAWEPPLTLSSVHVDGPFIAITFDDGPSNKLTPRLLDILAAHHIKATFFVVGQNAAEYPDILKRAASEGHEIANHTWSHPSLTKLSETAVRAQLQKTDDAIVAATGVRPVLLRPPYGSITARQKQWIPAEFGYHIVLWDVDPLDWKRPGPRAITSRIVNNTRPGSIVLAHDIHPGTVEAMPETLDELQAKGFRFVTVSELLTMAQPPPPRENEHAATPLPAESPAPSAVGAAR